MNVETHKTSNNVVKAWISAMRLRTLPLALASTFTGGFLAMLDGPIDGLILTATAITTILLQINSNLANDYGDFEHGTDNDERIGPERALQSGALQPAQMKRAIGLFSFLAFASGCWLLWLAPLDLITKGILLLLGMAAIYASVKYTAGSNPYGYRGLGDVSVMAFFGILGVLGSHLCQTGAFDWWMLLPALGIGAFSTAVLNVNNTRDIESDTNAGKITLAVKLGPAKARMYHVLLIAIGCDAFIWFGWFRFTELTQWLFVLSLPLFLFNAWKVYTTEASKLDPMLKQLALSTFLLSLLLGVGMAL